MDSNITSVCYKEESLNSNCNAAESKIKCPFYFSWIYQNTKYSIFEKIYNYRRNFLLMIYFIPVLQSRYS